MFYINDTKSVTLIAVEIIILTENLIGTENFQSVYQDGISTSDTQFPQPKIISKKKKTIFVQNSFGG